MNHSRFLAAAAMTLMLATGCDQSGLSVRDTDTTANAVVPMEQAMTPLYENEYVRVLRFDVAPGKTIAEHPGRNRVIYALSDYTIAWREEGKSETTTSWKAGDVHAHEALSHSLTNIGDTPAQFLVFERQDATLPASSTATELDAAIADSEHASLLFENEHFQVIRVSLAPEQAQPLHEGGWRVIYSLTDYALNWREGDDPVVEKHWSQGQVHWHEPGFHAAENVGETTAEWLIVTLK